jgi:hypothetical protein
MTALLALSAAVLVTGALAPADPGVLEAVQARRVANGWGLEAPAPEGSVLLALDDCGLLGRAGLVLVDGEAYPAYVVDCASESGELAARGLAADVNDAELGHKRAVIVVWNRTVGVGKRKAPHGAGLRD